MPVGLLWCMKVGRLTVCLLNLANKCHPAKASGHPLAFCFLCLTGEGPLEGSGEGRGWEQVHRSVPSAMRIAWAESTDHSLPLCVP